MSLVTEGLYGRLASPGDVPDSTTSSCCLAVVRPKIEHSLGEYTEPSFRGARFVLVVSVVVVAIPWLAYSWALSHPGVPNPSGADERVTASIAALGIA
jgi:hypothetical protein